MTPTQIKRMEHILGHLYTQGTQSRAQLAVRTKTTPATISRDTAIMLSWGLVEECGLEPLPTHHPGPRQVLLRVASGGSAYLGIELTANSYTFCLSDRTGHLLAQQIISRNQSYQRDFLNVATLIRYLKQFLSAHQDLPPVACGVALPGHHIEATNRISSANVTWAYFDLNPLEAALDVPVFYENNVNCEALAESLIGPNRNGENFVYVHVARGIFSATIHDHKMYGTKNFAVGEISHTIVNPEGELCDCGRHGCLQTYASHEWLVKKARLLYANSPDTILHQLVKKPDDIHIETVITAYQMGDLGIITLLTNAVRSIAAVLNNLALVIDARRMIVHGLLFDQPDLFHRLQMFLDQNQFQLTAVASQQLYVKPFDPMDGAIGGAMLAVSRMLLTSDGKYFNCPPEIH
ncbi:ROK family transcriptional regulator [Lacticaseibacillus porcinae]|uniref:ROK family transcriptional regulator n=1 Tax=Lacticaseibacillus porcinae TaxID=1123687 RepID=UPI000F7B55A6|nr:ROK family transcriptional regulator [Lacticaseibacillus porcinae]